MTGSPSDERKRSDVVESAEAGSQQDGVFRAMVQASPDPIVLLDEDMRVTVWNSAAASLFGWSAEEIEGKRAPFVPPDRTAEFQSFLEELDRDGEKRAIETVRRGKEGERIEVSLSSTRIDHDDFVGYLAIFKDIRKRKQRERDLQQVKQVLESLRPIIHAITEVSTPETIKQAACEQLVISEAYRFAWYADYNHVAEEITPTQWAEIANAGMEDDSIEVGGPESDVDTLHRVIQTHHVQVIRDVGDHPVGAVWSGEYLDEDDVVAILPVYFDSTVFGVVGLHTDREAAFDEYEREFLREIGELVGHAIHAAENKRLLYSESVVELEFRTRGTESVFVEVADRLDCRFDLEAFIPATETAFLAYTSVTGAPPDAIVDHLSTSSTVEGLRVVHADETEGTIEYKVNESPVSKLLDYGATVKSAVVEHGEERIVAEVAPGQDIHQIVAGLQDAYSQTTLVSKRSIDRPPRTIKASQDPLEDVLTDRQRKMLELAYHAGFFETPRHSSGDEIAESVGISSPTFYTHVRKATRNLVEWLSAEGMLG
ncbi:MAG: bacterio-opsin activator domain-containing protein [Halodesulfurarchaeum sp.]